LWHIHCLHVPACCGMLCMLCAASDAPPSPAALADVCRRAGSSGTCPQAQVPLLPFRPSCAPAACTSPSTRCTSSGRR
jgi:hypothetical protein